MGVYVPNMKFPKNCFDCEFSHLLSFDDELYCFNIGTTVNGEEKSKECTLVEVPTPHGRLIDADVAAEQLTFEMAGTGYQTRAVWIVELESSVPTVIESEE